MLQKDEIFQISEQQSSLSIGQQGS